MWGKCFAPSLVTSVAEWGFCFSVLWYESGEESCFVSIFFWGKISAQVNVCKLWLNVGDTHSQQ